MTSLKSVLTTASFVGPLNSTLERRDNTMILGRRGGYKHQVFLYHIIPLPRIEVKSTEFVVFII